MWFPDGIISNESTSVKQVKSEDRFKKGIQIIWQPVDAVAHVDRHIQSKKCSGLLTLLTPCCITFLAQYFTIQYVVVFIVGQKFNAVPVNLNQREYEWRGMRVRGCEVAFSTLLCLSSASSCIQCDNNQTDCVTVRAEYFQAYKELCLHSFFSLKSLHCLLKLSSSGKSLSGIRITN